MSETDEPLTEEDLQEIADSFQTHGMTHGTQEDRLLAEDGRRLVAEVRRLRGIVLRVAEPPLCPRADGRCVFCWSDIEDAPTPEPHKPDCVWLDVEREAKP